MMRVVKHETVFRSGIHELILRRAVDTSSPVEQKRQRQVVDTSSMYVRGEENLCGWQVSLA